MKKKLNNPKKKKWLLIIILFVMIPIDLLMIRAWLSEEPKEITYHEFQKMLEKNQIQSAVLDRDKEKVTITDKEKRQYVTESPQYEDFKKDLMEKNVNVTVSNSSEWSTTINSILSILFYVAIGYMIYSSMSIGRFSKAETPVVIPKTKFSDVAGYSEQKEDLQMYVEYLKNPKKFYNKGANMPRGVLLYGPPGTGKTLFARAIAGEAEVPFFSVSGSDFVEMFVGVGAKRVRKLFEQARQKAPCIIFIDEIDAIGGKRNASSNSEQTQTINALLTEMDGFDKEKGILVIATTNQPESLDPALVRSGRFDSHISIPLPLSAEEREQIIEVHKKGREFEKDVDFKSLAKQWIGFSGADIESILNEASIIAVKNDLPKITKACIDEAFYKKILKGHIKKTGQEERDQEEIALVAFHEAGHAVVRSLLGAGEVSKVTILSTTNGAGGVTFNIPKKMGLYSKEELESEIKVLYGGRAAEYLYFDKDFNKVTTGASNDIEKATSIIKNMVMSYGLQSEQMLMNLHDTPNANAHVFFEMKTMSQNLFNQTVELLETHYDLLTAVANRLIEKETIESEELQEIISNYVNKDNGSSIVA